MGDAQALKDRARFEVDRLTALGRDRELSQAESLLLERAIHDADGRPYPKGLTRALVRHGIKRDMARFGRPAS